MYIFIFMYIVKVITFKKWLPYDYILHYLQNGNNITIYVYIPN